MYANGHCDSCSDGDKYCQGLQDHPCNEYCDDPHLTESHVTSLVLMEALIDMGMSEHQLKMIAQYSDGAGTFRKYLIDNLK